MAVLGTGLLGIVAVMMFTGGSDVDDPVAVDGEDPSLDDPNGSGSALATAGSGSEAAAPAKG